MSGYLSNVFMLIAIIHLVLCPKIPSYLECFDRIFRYNFSMATTKTTWKTKSNQVSRRNSRKDSVSEVVIEKKISDDSEAGVSVFTKTTTPKVVIQSEEMRDPEVYQNVKRHNALKSICLIVMSIIILMTFFLCLKTYNDVNELYQLLN